MEADTAKHLADIATAFGVVLIGGQLTFALIAMFQDHKRSRRQFAIELSRDWNLSRSPETSAARRIIEKLNDEQFSSIANYQSVTIPGGHLTLVLVEECLERGTFFAGPNDTITLDPAAAKRLRYLGGIYLNALEVVLSAWLEGVGDRKYLEKQFAFAKDTTTMQGFRKTLRDNEGASFPAIEAFVNRHISRPRNPLGVIRFWLGTSN